MRDKVTLTFPLISFSFDGQVRKVRCASPVKLFLAPLAPQENQESKEKLDSQVKRTSPNLILYDWLFLIHLTFF